MDQFQNNNTPHPAPRIAFIQARWHSEIVDQCRVGFEGELKSQGVIPGRFDVYDVPGSFDIPLLAKKLAETGHYDAIVATGLVVDGGIYRHDFVAGTVVNALLTAQMETGVPMLSAVLTPHHFQEHTQHIEFFTKHFLTKGQEAARACLQIIGTFRRVAELTAA
ncbi:MULTISPECIES: 6,7-dimethyl-8-ribityllumazine synthase [unclassified Phyllobacterium]|uniref:6,7-dimethyl-8-ribityllumazine synthase n=1 Tax=Phyllobacterium TaxID=28100 RepID=UPI000DD5D04A|nr:MULTISPECIES: 6,7-dimethyl-8-ribityllumazine synthase [unclassified Phyllobacterium]MBA8899232.1 6,7-dimethyl-8-ribityllumazine synthase [Phyllobacterium sp. P30BS-XVII]UGX85272.1 6,7-dimethyl-8-ribityllumazine synthase [Phyllobacterium sp. T1293]